MIAGVRETSFEEVRGKYNQQCHFCDQMEMLSGRTFKIDRQGIFHHLRGKSLEIGVGTRKTLYYYNELIKFDNCRRTFEKRLKELGDNEVEKFDPVVQWMRLVIAEKAPELLNKA